ncbi:hypothetical protein SO802_028641 [Lithocarpus litseifolius]|uniref:Uncharacterized protein n=1 Tax=Lithocarpus litseifolius TaxID=425828 RepID=A0AAW2BT26_9ROSI
MEEGSVSVPRCPSNEFQICICGEGLENRSVVHCYLIKVPDPEACPTLSYYSPKLEKEEFSSKKPFPLLVMTELTQSLLCLILLLTIHPASRYIYCVILENSPKDNGLSISILSIQKYSLDEDIDFLYCAEIQNKESKETVKAKEREKDDIVSSEKKEN